MVLFSGSKAGSSPSARRKGGAVNGGGSVSNARGLTKGGATTSLAMAATNTPKTNPIAQIYEIGEQTGTGGLAMMWKIFSAVKLNTKEEVSIFFFDKSLSVKIPSKCQRAGRTTITELMRYDATQLQNIRHSRILKILEPVKENSESLAFATEPVLGSLSDLLATSHSGDQTPSDGEVFRLEEMEIKCGILQITEALAFLHSGAGWLHMSVCPENIYVTKWASWKLGGFFFAEKLQNGLNIITCWRMEARLFFQRAPNTRWTTLKPSKSDTRVQPNLNFLAPECLVDAECTPAADIFSLAATICTIYNGKNQPLIESAQHLDSYSKQLLELEKKVVALSGDMGPNLTEALFKMLSVDVKLRPSAQLFLLIKFFNDQGMLCLRLLEDVQYADTVQKVQFYCSQLKDSLCVIPEKLWFSRILPRLKSELRISPDLASAIVKPLMFMLQHCSDDHVHFLRPVFKRLIAGAKLEHAMLLSNLMENIEMVMKRVPEVQTPIVQLVFNSIKAVGNPQAQDAAVSCLPKVKQFLTSDYAETKLFPILREMFSNAPAHLQVRTLDSLAQMLSLATPKAMAEFLRFLASSRFEDAQVINALAKFYEAVLLESDNLGVSADCVATLLLPSFSPLIAFGGLNQQQLTNAIQACRMLIEYISEQKLGPSDPHRPLSFAQRSDSYLQVPSATSLSVRPQRHSIGGGVLPQVMITSPSSGQKPFDKHRDDSALSDKRPVQNDKNRKYSTFGLSTGIGVANSMGSENFLTPRSHPSSPHQRRHSVTVPPRPNSFTNLSHNIACMLSWKKKA